MWNWGISFVKERISLAKKLKILNFKKKYTIYCIFYLTFVTFCAILNHIQSLNGIQREERGVVFRYKREERR